MGIGKRIKEARNALNMTQEELAKLLGVTKGAIANYENETSHPKEPIMYKMFEALNVDANYLFQDVVNLPTKKNNVTLAEYEHIKKYRKLDPHGTEIVDFVLKKEYERSIAASPQPVAVPVRLISYYYKNASAGTGQVIFDYPPDTNIEIPDIQEYKNVSYAIGVNGSSMEPLYHDGDILLIEATREMQIGDIGIFQVNEECFVKKLGESELISLNSDFPNIPLNNSATALGKVIDIFQPT